MKLFNYYKTQCYTKSKNIGWGEETDETEKYSGFKIFQNEDSISDYGNSTTMQSETNEMI